MDVFVVHYAEKSCLYYVGIDVHEAFEILDELKKDAKVELWTDGKYVRDLSSVEDYISPQPQDY